MESSAPKFFRCRSRALTRSDFDACGATKNPRRQNADFRKFLDGGSEGNGKTVLT